MHLAVLMLPGGVMAFIGGSSPMGIFMGSANAWELALLPLGVVLLVVGRWAYRRFLALMEEYMWPAVLERIRAESRASSSRV